MNKERITVKVPAKDGGVVEFKLRASDIIDATRVMEESVFNPMVLLGVKDSVKYTVKVVERISVPLLGRVLELRGVKARTELVNLTDEYIITNEKEETVRVHRDLYCKLVRELLSIAPGQWYTKAWVAVKTVAPS